MAKGAGLLTVSSIRHVNSNGLRNRCHRLRRFESYPSYLDAHSNVHKKMRVVLEGALLKLIYKHLENLPSHLYLGADVTQLARVIGKDSITH